MDERVISFLIQNTTLTIAVCRNNVPYCANCFYSFDQENFFLVFKSKREAEHIRCALENKNVAGSILPNKIDFKKIQGIQFNGNLLEPYSDLLEGIKKLYYKKYPFALAFTGEIWAVELTSIKLTDNTIGFGKRIEWKK